MFRLSLIRSLGMLALCSGFWGTFAIGNSPKAEAGTFTFLAGRKDNFATADGLEPANPRPAHDTSVRQGLQSFIGLSCASIFPRCEPKQFDDFSFDRDFRHSFDLSGITAPIISASLETRLRGNGFNDTISLRFVDNQTNPAWGRFFGSGNSQPGLINSSWSNGIERTFIFDLANLPSVTPPNIDLLSTLNVKKFLDIHIQDDTFIDYIELTVQTQEAVPEPSSRAGIIGFGLLGLAWIVRNKFLRSF